MQSLLSQSLNEQAGYKSELAGTIIMLVYVRSKVQVVLPS